MKGLTKLISAVVTFIVLMVIAIILIGGLIDLIGGMLLLVFGLLVFSLPVIGLIVLIYAVVNFIDRNQGEK